MRIDARDVAARLTFAATIGALLYGAVSVHRVRAFGRRVREDRAQPAWRPAVTIMKPVRGVDTGLEENLRSFCNQEYPDFHVVFGVHQADDPALDVIQRVAAAAPERTTVVVGDGLARCRNPKMANVAPMVAHAHGDIYVIADSDMRVTPDYLDAVVAAFADPSVGAVTARFRGEPADATLASTLGAMSITEQFMPSALVAEALEPVKYLFGSTMAVRRNILEAIGGITVVGDHLADDFTLGRLVTEQGYRVAIASYVVANIVAEPGVRALIEHELRWARTIRAVKPFGYPATILTYPLPVALAHLALARKRRTALALVAIAALLRLALRNAAHGA
nr:bacteriohopanetetrol glucosamine biosynthesis glycosyltransferase HpnI [Candidatus Eremiobacteraeota bacterium]